MVFVGRQGSLKKVCRYREGWQADDSERFKLAILQSCALEAQLIVLIMKRTCQLTRNCLK